MTRRIPPATNAPGRAAEKKSENLYAAGLIIVAVSSLLHFVWDLPYADYAMAMAGGLMALSLMLKGAFGEKADGTVRSRRLDRMRLLGGLIFMVAGGFAVEGQNLWILLFAAATVFTLYGIFVGDRKES